MNKKSSGLNLVFDNNLGIFSMYLYIIKTLWVSIRISLLQNRMLLGPIKMAPFQNSVAGTYENGNALKSYEPHHEKTGFLHMRKQRCRSAVQ